MNKPKKPNPSFHNTCILIDMNSFENLPNMMDEKLNLKSEFYHLVEWDECGNIVKVMGRKVIYLPMIYRLEKKDDGIKLPYDFNMDEELANLKQEVSNITYTHS